MAKQPGLFDEEQASSLLGQLLHDSQLYLLTILKMQESNGIKGMLAIK